MKQRSFILFLSLAGLFLLGGCGGGGGTSGTALHESQVCIDCHDGDNWKTPGSGQPIVAEWKASTHNTNDGAGCQDCHGSGYMHPNSCNKCHSVGITASNPRLNPDADGMCANCHSTTKRSAFKQLTYSSGIRRFSPSPTTAFAHFSSSDGTTRISNYVSTNYLNNCRKCHNPHDTAFGREQRKQWAESGHGNTTGVDASTSDFKKSGSSKPAYNNFGDVMGSFCVRCHTTTGYINYLTSGFSDVRALPDYDGVRGDTSLTANPRTTYLDKTKEMTGCNACHEDARSTNAVSGSSYSGRVRRVPQVVTYYSYESSIAQPLAGLKQRYKLPSTIAYANLPASNYVTQNGEKWGLQLNDFGLSNVCVSCHSGREIGMMIKVASVGNPEINAVEAGRSLPLDFTKANSALNPHVRAAASTLNGVSGFEFYADKTKYANPASFAHNKLGLAPNYYGDSAKKGNGPCITCHVANNSKSHLFLPVDGDDDVISTACNGCHSAQPIDIAAQKEGYAAALKALRFVGFHIDSYSTDAALGTNYDNRFQLALNLVYKIVAVTTYPSTVTGDPAITTAGANAAVFNTGHSTSKWGVFGRLLNNPTPVGWGGNTIVTSASLATTINSVPIVAGNGDGITFKDYILPGSGNPLDNNVTDAITAGGYTMGASFNYTLLSSDPGAFAHNPTYVKRLIYDSIDWLDNGVMDGTGSVENYLTTTLANLAGSSFAANPALHAVSNGAIKSVTILLRSGSGTVASPYKFTKFEFTSDDLAKAIAFLSGAR